METPLPARFSVVMSIESFNPLPIGYCGFSTVHLQKEKVLSELGFVDVILNAKLSEPILSSSLEVKIPDESNEEKNFQLSLWSLILSSNTIVDSVLFTHEGESLRGSKSSSM